MTAERIQELKKQARQEIYIARVLNRQITVKESAVRLGLTEEEMDKIIEEQKFVRDYKIGYIQGYEEEIYRMVAGGFITMEQANKQLHQDVSEDVFRARAELYGIMIS